MSLTFDRNWHLACGPERLLEGVLAFDRLGPLLSRIVAREHCAGVVDLEVVQAGAHGWEVALQGLPAPVLIRCAVNRQRQRAEFEGRGSRVRLRVTTCWTRVPGGSHLSAEVFVVGDAEDSVVRPALGRSTAAATVRVLRRALAICVVRDRWLRTRVERLPRGRCTRCLGPMTDGRCGWADHAVSDRYYSFQGKGLRSARGKGGEGSSGTPLGKDWEPVGPAPQLRRQCYLK